MVALPFFDCCDSNFTFFLFFLVKLFRFRLLRVGPRELREELREVLRAEEPENEERVRDVSLLQERLLCETGDLEETLDSLPIRPSCFNRWSKTSITLASGDVSIAVSSFFFLASFSAVRVALKKAFPLDIANWL